MLDRKTPPPFQTIENINILPMQTKTLSNGVKFHSLSVGKQEIIKFEIVFFAGTNYENTKSLASSTAKMLFAGTKKYNANQINEFFDNFGAYHEVNVDLKHTTISIFVLRKYLKNVLPFLVEILEETNFPIDEWQIEQKKSIQNLILNLEKTNFLARQYFREKLFGENHSFGKKTTTKDIENLTIDDLKKYFKNYFQNKYFEIFLTGSFDEQETNLIDNLFSVMPIDSKPTENIWNQPNTDLNKEFYLDMSDKMQTSFCMGNILFNQKHQDYLQMRILSTIFGGYFGSRLMKNIREEKGYTYGISSQVVPLVDTGYFVILADVKKEFYQNVLTEIHKEAKILQTELVSEAELSTVRNYLLGKFADSINTSFELADLFKNVYFSDLSYDYYHQYIKTIQMITPEEILSIAQKYLKTDLMTCVGVG
ncbi:MAG: insulinase family protein [Bacteroidetes bacterium]|nr:MAG: insulinase family protein [Bacteroidota bacterium]TAG86048.1 MAG: insulinase family protein [Bacteroidota bacterium]